MLEQLGQHRVKLVVLYHAYLQLLPAPAVTVKGLRVRVGTFFVFMHLASDVVDVGWLFCYVLLDFF